MSHLITILRNKLGPDPGNLVDRKRGIGVLLPPQPPNYEVTIGNSVPHALSLLPSVMYLGCLDQQFRPGNFSTVHV